MSLTRSVYLMMLAAATLWGQSPPKNPVSSVVREILPRQQKNLTEAVDEMPASKFNYKPTPQQMTFAHLVVHITDSNNYLCAKIGDAAAPKTPQLKETDGKDKLLAALKSSFAFCSTALEKVDDSRLGDTIQAFGGREAPKAWALFALSNDWADHYGAAAMYLRLNGLLPPTAKK
jgi:uncharacterized damage-inducible protein DinB